MNNKNLINNDKGNKTYNKLSEALRIAIGYRSVKQFVEDCRMVDLRLINAILNKELNEPPAREILRTFASASQGRITHTYLYDICNYSEQDETEDKRWMLFPASRGEIYYADLGCFGLDSEQNSIRPCLIVSNDVGNMKSGTLVIAPITSKFKKQLPTHVKLTYKDKVREESLVMLEQVRCISKRRLYYSGYPWLVTKLSEEKMNEINNAIEIEFGLTDVMFNEERAFEMIKKLKALEYNIKNKRSVDLLDLFDEKLDEFVKYCVKYKRDSEYVMSEFERLDIQYCAG